MNGRRKILMVGLSVDRVERHVMRRLPSLGYEVHAIAQPGSPAVEDCRKEGIPVVEHEFSGRIDFDGISLIRSQLDGFDPDIFHALTNRALSNGLLASRHRKSQQRVLAYRGTMGHLSRFDPASWMSYLHLRVDGIACVSNAVRDYLGSMGIPEEKLHTIYKGHDPDWYTGQANPALLDDFDFPEGAYIVGFTGNIRPVKGIPSLIEACLQLPADSPVHVLLIGEVRDQRVRQLLDRPTVKARVKSAGFRGDAPALAGACDATVMPSIEREGLPKGVIESMAQGLPPIVTRVGGMPELVSQGACGLVVPPKDPAALAAAMHRLATEEGLAARIGAAARHQIETAFHVRHTVEKTSALYESLLP